MFLALPFFSCVFFFIFFFLPLLILSAVFLGGLLLFLSFLSPVIKSASSTACSEAAKVQGPYSAQICINFAGKRLLVYAHRLQMMRYSNDRQLVYDGQFKEERLTGIGARERGWKHWRGKNAICFRSVGPHTDSSFVRCKEERASEAQLKTLVEFYITNKVPVMLRSLHLKRLERPLRSLFWVENV